MQKKTISFLALAFFVQVVLPVAIWQAVAQAERSLSGHGPSRSVPDAR